MSDRAIFDSALSFNNPFEEGFYSAFSKNHILSKPIDTSFSFDHVIDDFFFSIVYFGATFRKFDAVFVECDLATDYVCIVEVQCVGICKCCSNAFAIVQDLNMSISQKHATLIVCPEQIRTSVLLT